MFMFVIHAEPSPDNKSHADLKMAHVHVWVNVASAEDALDLANAYITRYGWTPLSVEHAFEIPAELIPRLGESESRLYKRACQYGIAADFLAVPLVEGKPNDPVRIERLKPPRQ